MKIYDITPAIGPDLKVWPGDTPASREVLLDMNRGDNLTLSTLRATVHLGAHADAPSHYGAKDPTIEDADLSRYVGKCQVITVDVQQGERVEELTTEVTEERVILRTGTYPDPTHFNEDFSGLSVALVDELHSRGVGLVGIDTPSVDLFSSKDLPAHNAFLRNGMYILEGLVLDGVPDGTYELMALPLKLVGFDASPVRAILREL